MYVHNNKVAYSTQKSELYNLFPIFSFFRFFMKRSAVDSGVLLLGPGTAKGVKKEQGAGVKG